MPTLSKEDIAAELLRRGVPPDRIRQAGYGQIAQQGEAGLIAPRFSIGDKVGDRQLTTRDYGQIRDERERLGRFYPDMTTLDRFHQLNAETGTGGLQHQDWNPIHGLVEMVNPRLKEMSGIASTLQGKARPVGSGATSDFEQRLYRMGVPSPEKAGPVNDSIENYMRGVLNEENDRLAFQEEFIRRNRTLNGAQEAWTRYVMKHPYTVTDPKTRQTVPNGRRQDWKTYFGLGPAIEASVEGHPEYGTGRAYTAPRVGGSLAGAPKKPSAPGQFKILDVQ
jgi:hypothetical protein